MSEGPRVSRPRESRAHSSPHPGGRPAGQAPYRRYAPEYRSATGLATPPVPTPERSHREPAARPGLPASRAVSQQSTSYGAPAAPAGAADPAAASVVARHRPDRRRPGRGAGRERHRRDLGGRLRARAREQGLVGPVVRPAAGAPARRPPSIPTPSRWRRSRPNCCRPWSHSTSPEAPRAAPAPE